MLTVLLALTLLQAQPAAPPQPVEGDFVIRDFRFASGETLPELRLHYRTLGTPQRDAPGRRAQRRADHARHRRHRGAVPAAASSPASCSARAACSTRRRYFIILPDGIGHGRSSKPSDGLRARFPRYGYRDMIEAQHRLRDRGARASTTCGS